MNVASVPIGPDPVWMLWNREKSLAPSRNRSPAVQPQVRHINLSSRDKPSLFMQKDKGKHLPYESLSVLYNLLSIRRLYSNNLVVARRFGRVVKKGVFRVVWQLIKYVFATILSHEADVDIYWPGMT